MVFVDSPAVQGVWCPEWEFFNNVIINKENILYIIIAYFCYSKLRTTRIIAGTERSAVDLRGNRAQRMAALKKIQTVETWRKIAAAYRHPRYNKRSIVNDIAVLLVSRLFTILFCTDFDS